MKTGHDFERVIFVDFEFTAPDGEKPQPICVVERCLDSGSSRRTWLGGRTVEAPYCVDRETLIVAYYASAEMGCHLALGWPIPSFVLDLYTEFRCLTNGRPTPCGAGLLGALAYFGIDSMAGVEKDSMRQLAIRGGPYTATEQAALLEYCESDVVALERLFRAMEPSIDWERALLRGRYMCTAAAMEYRGVPIDISTFGQIRDNWQALKADVTGDLDESGVYVDGSFRAAAFAEMLAAKNIPWPRSDGGRLLLDDETFGDMAAEYPAVRPIRELRKLRAQLRPPQLTVGSDGRNRCLLSAFRSRTGRNQPSNSRFIFGAPSWMRGLVQPGPGMGLAYVDWSQQEFGIAAALSADPAMLEAYRSDDPYLAFARQAGAVPQGATKTSHPDQREKFKQCVLGVQYGMGPRTLAQRIGQSEPHARELLNLHHRAYPRFWRWHRGVLDFAMLYGQIHTVFGWTFYPSDPTKWRMLANFPMQANGAEMLRVACIDAWERELRLCAPVHDAVLIEAPVEELSAAVAQMRQSMARASRAVLDGFELRTDVTMLLHPDRLIATRSRRVWDAVIVALERRRSPVSFPGHQALLQRCNKVVALPPTRPLLSLS